MKQCALLRVCVVVGLSILWCIADSTMSAMSAFVHLPVSELFAYDFTYMLEVVYPRLLYVHSINQKVWHRPARG